MINIKLLDTYLQALKDKNIDSIIAKQTYIPSLGDKYSANELRAWIQKRIDFLTSLKGLTDIQASSLKNDYYTSLSTKDKTVADKILTNKEVEFSDEEQWENLVLINLYNFVTKS